MTLFIGLTGSIGMGKSTTAQMFRDEEIPIYDADATVHRLYAGDAVPLVEAEFPGTAINGRIDRQELSKHVIGDEAAMKRLEAIVHPLVRREELAFRNNVTAEGHPFAILDSPLLFEMKGDASVDGIIVVTAPAEIQRQRVLARPEMNEEKFNAILARQVPDAEKRKKADFIIDTSQGMEAAHQNVLTIINKIRSGAWTPNKQV